MPLYDFTCRRGHTTEKRATVDVESIRCPLCGEPAQREAVYLHQYCITETGTLASRQAVVPRDEKNYRNEYRRFKEASAEMNYYATEFEDNTGQGVNPRLYTRAKKRAKRIKAGVEAPLSKG